MSEDSGESKKEKKFKMMIRFERDTFDFFDIKRIETTEGFDDELEEVTYYLTIRFQSYPFEKVYKYQTPELVELKKMELEDKLESLRAVIL